MIPSIIISILLLLFSALIDEEQNSGVQLYHKSELMKKHDTPFTGTRMVDTKHLVSVFIHLAPGAEIPEHHHPVYHENIVALSGELSLWLDDEKHTVRAGDIVFVPAGTIMRGINEGDTDFTAVATFANIGKEGPLMVQGRPGE